jgi:CRISPR/Cas system-associated exonuclease Cas4 (RecB family)
VSETLVNILQGAFRKEAEHIAPLVPPGIERLSVSSIDGFWKCAERWRREKLGRERQSTYSDQLFGGAFHKAAEVNFRQKIESHEDLPLPFMRDIAGEAFNLKLEEELGENEIIWKDKPNDVQQAVIKAVVGTDSFPGYQQVLAPIVQPAEVERWVEVPTRIGVPLVAKIDVETIQDVTIDLKSGKKAKTQADLDKSAQATTYLWLRRQEFKPATEFRWHTAIQYKTKPAMHQELATTRTDAQFRAFELLLQQTAQAMSFYYQQFGPDGPWPGAPEAGWWCSPGQCGFFPTCHWKGGATNAIA